VIKRTIDLSISLVALIMLSPFFIAIALLVKVKLGSPVFFRQARPGRNGKVFHLFKFRTMLDARDKDGNLLPDEQRMTKLGAFLRSTSLDEIPGLFSVIKGDMSLVGPRPLLVRYLPLYNNKQARRHEVKPGITGWAQVNGRNAISWEEKFELDVWYVDNQTIWLDLKILFLTMKKVFIKEGISANEHVTMPEFLGTKNEK